MVPTMALKIPPSPLNPPCGEVERNSQLISPIPPITTKPMMTKSAPTAMIAAVQQTPQAIFWV
jgi:hypothetical protein